MKKPIATLFLSFLIICTLFSGLVFAQGFSGVTSPDGNNVIAVGNSGKIYRSTNAGISYISYIYGTANFHAATSLGNDVWFTGQNGNVHKTLKTNAPINSYNAGTAASLNGITFIDPNTGFVCGDAGVIYKTVNGGINWSLSNSGIPLVKLNSIKFKDADNGTVVGNNGSIYVTNNGGTSWTAQLSGTANNLLKVKYFNDSLVAAGEFGTLLISNGKTWTAIASRTRTDITGITGTSSGDVHICGGGGFIRNNRNGNSKFNNFELNPMMANLVDIHYFDHNRGWAVSSLNSVIIYTSNGGASWNMPSGATSSNTWVQKLVASGGIGNNLCEHPFNRNALFVMYRDSIYVSRNKGDNWTRIAVITGSGITGGRAHSFYVSPLDTNVWLAAIDNVTPDKVIRSTNYGLTWTTILSKNFSNYGQPLEMDQNNPSVYYFASDSGGSNSGFYKSTDNGASFTNINSGAGNYKFRSPCDIMVMWDSSNVIYVADGITSSGLADIFKSVNGGLNWTKVHTNPSSSEVPSMCNSVFDRTMAYATNWGGGDLYKTTNGGDNWFLLSTQATSGWGSDVCREDPTVVLKGTYGSPHYLTTNSGSSFTSTNIAGGSGAGIIVPDRSFLIAMQSSGLFKMNIVYQYSPPAGSLFTQMNIKLAPEGLYNGSTLNLRDTVTVYLRNITPSYAAADSSKTTIDSLSLTAACTFSNANNGTYYIQVKHRNSIETWSKSGGESFTRGVTSNFDFTSAQNQAYGNNTILKLTKWCFYSGDINQDGIIDASDLSAVDNDAFNSVSGYVKADVNGDLFVDASDLSIVDNNVYNSVVRITPLGLDIQRAKVVGYNK